MVNKNHSKNNIAMIVYNSVSHDARVLKEANSLASVGYNVRIFGIKDDKNYLDYETLENNIQVVRVSWRPYLYKRLALITLFLTLLTLLLVYAAANWVNAHMSISISTGELINSVLQMFSRFLEHDFLGLMVVLLSIAIAYYGLRLAIAYLRISSRYGAKELSSDAKRSFTDHPRFRLLLYLFDYKVIKGQLLQISLLFRRMAGIWSMKSRIYPKLEEYKPDIIHCHDLPTLPLGVKYKNRNKIELVYDSHEIYEEQGAFGLLQKFMFRMIQKSCSSEVDYFITINDSIAHFLTTRYRHLPTAVIIKNATQKLIERVSYDGRLHKAAGVDLEAKILLYQGGFGPRRGLEVLVRSAPLLPNDWYLVMMGWGSLERKLRTLAGQVDATGARICFVPAVPGIELPYWTAGGSIGVIPYENVNMNHWFCTPNKLWEYPNSGVPLLVSPFPEMKKVVEENEIGWLLDLKLTPSNIARIVSSLSDAEIERAVVACRSFIEKDNWSVYEPKLIKIYHQMGKKGGADSSWLSDDHKLSSDKIPPLSG